MLVDGDDHVHRHGEVGTRGLRHRISCGDAAGARDRRCRMRARRAAGLLACLSIVWISKWLGHAFLMRTKDPYTGDHLDTVEENRENE